MLTLLVEQFQLQLSGLDKLHLDQVDKDLTVFSDLELDVIAQHVERAQLGQWSAPDLTLLKKVFPRHQTQDQWRSQDRAERLACVAGLRRLFNA